MWLMFNSKAEKNEIKKFTLKTFKLVRVADDVYMDPKGITYTTGIIW